MNFKAYKIFLIASAFVITLLAVFSFIPAMSAASPKHGEKIIISDFEKSEDGFFAANNYYDLSKTDLVDENGEKRSCLEVESMWISISSLRTVMKEASIPFDFTDYRHVSYDIFVPEYSSYGVSAYYARLTLYSADGSIWESLESVEAGKWNTVKCDISGWSGRSSVSAVEITFTVDTSANKYVADSFYIDNICASEKFDGEMIQRFLFDSYDVAGGTGITSKDKKTVTLLADSSSSMRFSASLFLPDFDYDVNCLRIKLANHTDNDSVTLYYSTVDERAVSENKSLILEIAPNSDSQYYYIGIEEVERIRDISLLFDADLGSVEISSLAIVPIHTPKKYDTYGSLYSCTVNKELTEIHFSGEINRQIALAHSEDSIKIFIIGDGELPSAEELRLAEPIVEGNMTTKFDLTWYIPADSELSLLERYMAVIMKEDGEYLLVGTPAYIDNPDAFSENTYPFPVDRKGYSTEDISLIGDTDTGITVVELDINEAFSEQIDELQYIYGGEVYYLSREYIENLTNKIEILSDMGVSVLIRITNRPRRTEGVPQGANDGDNQNTGKLGNDFVGAVSAYISENFVAAGKACGAILGQGENCIEAEESFGSMIVDTVSALRSISVNLLKANSEARAYISLTDLLYCDSTDNNNNYEIPLFEYLTAFLSEIHAEGNFPYGICVESLLRLPRSGDTYLTQKDIDKLYAITSRYGKTAFNPIFCDNIYYSETFLENYVTEYYEAIFNDKVDGYIVVSSGRVSGLTETVKYIDSDKSDEIVSTALEAMNFKGLYEVVENYSEDRLLKRHLSVEQGLASLPESIIGSCGLFKLKNATDMAAFKAGYYGENLHLENDKEKGISLSMTVGQILYDGGAVAFPSWSGVMLPFEHTENLDFMSFIGVTLKLYENNDGVLRKVPIKLVLKGENERFESVSEIDTGKWNTVYFNIDGFKAAENTESMQILIGDIKSGTAELLIKEISGHSKDYNDESLEKLVREERLQKATGYKKDYSPYIWVGGVMLTMIATGIAIALLSRKKRGGD